MNKHINDNSLLRKKQSTSMVVLDIGDAFDTVWLAVLISKKINYNFAVYLIKLIHSYR
jgi:hypothetical protein